MARRIPQNFIDELISRADVLDVIGTRVSLKRAGSNYKGLCPFHDEKTPSFTVSPQKGFYHCFGCGAHGTAIGFLMDYDNLSFPEAVEALAEMLGLEVPVERQSREPDESTDLFGLLEEADRLFRSKLRESSEAVAYLKRRGVDGATAARFGLGYAPDAWDTVLAALGTSSERIAGLLRAGLLAENERGRRYDRFRDRITFPIRDTKGRVIGFGGRVLDSGEPKYLNSPETPVFHKGRALYGLFEARRRPGRPEQVVVVEGYLDVISLAQAGIEPAVATLGTAATTEHIRRLTRLTDRVIFCFDGDSAGRAAAWRALETALPFGGGTVELKFLLLPEGEDPDSLVRRDGAEAFAALLDAATPLSRFLVDRLRSDIDMSAADGRARLIAEARPLLARNRLPEGAYRRFLIADLAALADMQPADLEMALDAAPQRAETPRAARNPSGTERSTWVREAIRLLLHYPSAAAKLEPVEGLAAVAESGVPLLLQLIEIARANPQISTAGLIERLRDDAEGRHLDRLAAREPLDDEEAAPAVIQEAMNRIVERYRRRQTAEAVKNRRPLGPSPDGR
jgi:DNA primase